MNKIRYAVLALFMCGAIAFQLFMPAELSNPSQNVAAKEDELSDTIWNIDGTIYALQFDSNSGVTFLEYNSRTKDFDSLAEGTYRVRRNIVTMTFEGESGNVTISGKKRNRLTGRIYVDGKVYTVKATRADG